MKKLTAEEFLREKLESEIQTFGDGTTDFHTRDLEHLLNCLDDKDEKIRELSGRCIELNNEINWNAKKQFNELLEVCMTINNLSAEQRLGYIRKQYKDIWTKIRAVAEKV